MLTAKLSRVFLIEDDTDDCEIFEQAFKEVSPFVHVSCSYDCVDVLKTIENFAPEIIFIDYHLPQKSGFICLQEIGVSAALNHIPIVMYTAWGNPADVKTAIRLGAKIYLEKPSCYAELVRHLKEVIQLNWQIPDSILPMHIKDGAFHPIIL